MAATIQANTYATVAYTLRTPKGDIIDGSSVEGGEPIQYVHGYGTLVPGLEAALAGLKAGDAKDLVIPADEGFGARDEDLVLMIDRNEFPDPAAIQLGDEFVAEFPEGEELAMRVVELLADGVRVDANHPLAGVDLHYSIKVEDVRDATPEEIEQARAEQEAAEEDDHDHDHEHDEDDEDLDEDEEDAGEDDEDGDDDGDLESPKLVPSGDKKSGEGSGQA